MESIVLGEFKLTGINKIDVDKVVDKWNHLWWISEHRRNNSWRLISYVRKDSAITKIKMTISIDQVRELIERLSLIPDQVFGYSYSWRRKIDVDYLESWRNKKYSK